MCTSTVTCNHCALIASCNTQGHPSNTTAALSLHHRSCSLTAPVYQLTSLLLSHESAHPFMRAGSRRGARFSSPGERAHKTVGSFVCAATAERGDAREEGLLSCCSRGIASRGGAALQLDARAHGGRNYTASGRMLSRAGPGAAASPRQRSTAAPSSCNF